MTQVAEQLKEQLAGLDQADRAELASFLIQSLDDADEFASIDDFDAAWKDELLQRNAEIESGKAKTIPAEVVYERVRSALSE